jgi:hypothetical protein
MAAVVGHLGHNVSKDVVGCCDVCFARKLASEPLSWQPPRQIGRFFASTYSKHHSSSCGGGGVGTEGGIRAGGEVFCSMRFLASIDHDGRRRPTATMRPYSRLLSIQQSTNMLGNRLVSLKLEKEIINYVY